MMGRRKVLLVDHVNKVMGGAEMNVVELLETCRARRSWETSVACAPGGGLALALGELGGLRLVHHEFPAALNQLRVVGRRISLWKAWAGWRETGRVAGRLGRFIREWGPEAVISCTNKDHFVSGMAARPLGMRPIWWVNDLLTSDFLGWIPRRMFWLQAYRWRPLLVAVSGAVGLALRRMGIPASWIRVIPNGIDPSRYHGGDGRSFRASLGVTDPGMPLVGWIGRWTPWKGPDVFLEVARAWTRSGRPGHFVMVGGAFNEEADYAERLKQQAIREGLQRNVTFLPFQEGIPDVLAGLDALIHTSVRPEPFGRVLIEGMAAGVPVIGTRGGGVDEILDGGRIGPCVRARDVEGYVRALMALQDSGRDREAWAGTLRAWVQERYHVDRVHEEFDRVCGEAVGRRGTG